MTNAIETAGLTKRYGPQTSVDHLDLCIPAAKITGFVGPNGAGKTTTIRMLLGLITPSEGEGTVLGHSITKPERYLERVGAMIEGPAFTPNLSGRANLDVLATLARIDRKRIDEVLELVDLTSKANQQFRSYSLGMKQRLGIAASLLPDPKLVILDEPTNGLDPEGIRDMRALLTNLADNGTTVFVSSHLLSELEHISEHLVMIEKGRLRYQGSLANLMAAQGSRAEITVEHPSDLAAVVELLAGAGYSVTVQDGALLVDAEPSQLASINRLAWQGGIALATLQPLATSLEEIFFSSAATATSATPATALEGALR